ncbi:hypothetical protein ACFL2B_00580 [Patescibacteria group bacterium]
MANQITHVVLTDKVFDKYFQGRYKRDFFIGTLFPDIRKRANIDRRLTHQCEGDISTITMIKDDFQAGLCFHDFLDKVRERFIEKSGIYEKFKEYRFSVLGIKAAEDEVFYNKCNEWQEISSYLDEVIPAELETGIAEKIIRHWHQLLQQYFKKAPTNETGMLLLRGIGFSEEQINEIKKEILLIKDDKQVREVAEKLYNNIENIIDRY